MLSGLRNAVRTWALLAPCSTVLNTGFRLQASCGYHRQKPGKALAPAESVIFVLEKQGFLGSHTPCISFTQIGSGACANKGREMG